MELLSWQRRAEISADRAGLLCCGSLDVASSAFFKIISGLSIPNLKVNPRQLGTQFDHLKEELFRDDTEEMCNRHGLHPFHGKTLEIGGYTVAGLGYSNPTPFNTPGEYTEEQVADQPAGSSCNAILPGDKWQRGAHHQTI